MPPNEDNSHYEKILATGEVRCIDSEIPFEIPDTWCWVRLSHVVQINPKNKADENIEAAFIPMELIDATYFSSYTFETKKWKTIKGGFTHFADGDIAFAKITPCFQNRKSMILRNLPNGIGAGTTELKVLRPYAKTINDFYLLFFLESAYFVEQATFKGTANQQRIISGYMENKLFPLPPIYEQQRIAEQLKKLLALADKYDKSQIALNKLNEELPKLMKQSVLQEAIQGKLVEQCATDEPAAKLLERIREEKKQLVKQGKLKAKDIVDSVIFKGDDNKYYEKCCNTITCIDAEMPFEIPKSWSWCRLSALMQILTGKKDANYGDEKGPYEFFTCSNTPLKSTTYSYDGDYLIMPGNGANIGQVIHYTGRFEAYQRTYLLHAYSLINLDYLKYHLMCNWKEYNQDKLYGSAIPYIKLGNLTSYLVALPPLVEQQRIVDKIEQSLASIMSR